MIVSYSSFEFGDSPVDALKKRCFAYLLGMCLSRSFKIGRPPNSALNGVINKLRWSWAWGLGVLNSDHCLFHPIILSLFFR